MKKVSNKDLLRDIQILRKKIKPQLKEWDQIHFGKYDLTPLKSNVFIIFWNKITSIFRRK